MKARVGLDLLQTGSWPGGEFRRKESQAWSETFDFLTVAQERRGTWRRRLWRLSQL